MSIYTVSQVTAYLRDILEEDYDLQSLSVRGEISNTIQASSGHWYFTLKDAHAQLRCVLWRTQAQEILNRPSDGASFIVSGHISIYEARGDVQLYVSDLRPDGLGVLFQQFLEIKNRLKAEGLFDQEKKLSIPSYPNTIGVVTSPDAAALQDVLHVLDRRFPCADLILSPATVQGPSAALTLIQALDRLVSDGRAAVIIICRGGGSMEDLWSFNDESLARAVAYCPIPIVSGIGHETDFTMVDFAADIRAPTPSAAAELATPDGMALRNTLKDWETVLKVRLQKHINECTSRLRQQQFLLGRLSPAGRINYHRQSIDEIRSFFSAQIHRRLTLYREKVDSRIQRLEGVNPSSILSRGYAYITNVEDDSHIDRAARIKAGELINLNFYDGRRRATAIEE